MLGTKPSKKRSPKTDTLIQETTARFAGRSFPCPLCSTPRPIGVDRRGKPYITCLSPCGLQMFVRAPQGRDLLEQQLSAHTNPAEAPGETRVAASAAALIHRGSFRRTHAGR